MKGRGGGDRITPGFDQSCSVVSSRVRSVAFSHFLPLGFLFIDKNYKMPSFFSRPLRGVWRLYIVAKIGKQLIEHKK